jgi:hypothetical protein
MYIDYKDLRVKEVTCTLDVFLKDYNIEIVPKNREEIAYIKINNLYFKTFFLKYKPVIVNYNGYDQCPEDNIVVFLNKYKNRLYRKEENNYIKLIPMKVSLITGFYKFRGQVEALMRVHKEFMLWLDEHPNLATSLGEAFTLYKLEKGEK